MRYNDAMGFRVRKSIKLGGGVRLNLSKSGIGMSAGVKGTHVGVNSKGRKYTTLSAPGTGLSYTNYSSDGAAKKNPKTVSKQLPANPVQQAAVLLAKGFKAYQQKG